jgi:hypothetical protein
MVVQNNFVIHIKKLMINVWQLSTLVFNVHYSWRIPVAKEEYYEVFPYNGNQGKIL